MCASLELLCNISSFKLGNGRPSIGKQRKKKKKRRAQMDGWEFRSAPFFCCCFALPRDAVIQRVGTLLTVTQEFKLSYWLSRHFSFKCNKAVRSLNSCEIQWLKWHYNLHFNVVQVTILTFRAIRWLFYLYWYLWCNFFFLFFFFFQQYLLLIRLQKFTQY